jgi:hypothetical protein
MWCNRLLIRFVENLWKVASYTCSLQAFVGSLLGASQDTAESPCHRS